MEAAIGVGETADDAARVELRVVEQEQRFERGRIQAS